MLKYVLKRLIITLPMVLVVITLTWGLVRLAPGNFYSSEKQVSAAVKKNLEDKYGRSKPWPLQYLKMLTNVLTGDFGVSLHYQGQSVNNILWRSLPVSAALGLAAYFLALVIGVGAGSLAALKQNTRWDYLSMGVAMFGVSAPNFVLGPVLILIFSLGLGWFPPARWQGFLSLSMVLPTITLAAIYTAYIARLTRSGMLEVLRSDYIRTARAKGLSEREIVLRHALRGGIMPVISFSGPALAFLITGAVVVEKIFALPGLGNYFLNANLNRDEPLIIGIVAFISIMVLFFNLLVDILYAYLDPRIRY
jgi:oligopeptide transport system permease protein